MADTKTKADVIAGLDQDTLIGAARDIVGRRMVEARVALVTELRAPGELSLSRYKDSELIDTVNEHLAAVATTFAAWQAAQADLNSLAMVNQ